MWGLRLESQELRLNVVKFENSHVLFMINVLVEGLWKCASSGRISAKVLLQFCQGEENTRDSKNLVLELSPVLTHQRTLLVTPSVK